MHISFFFKFRTTFTSKYLEKIFSHDRDFLFTVRNELTLTLQRQAPGNVAARVPIAK